MCDGCVEYGWPHMSRIWQERNAEIAKGVSEPVKKSKKRKRPKK